MIASLMYAQPGIYALSWGVAGGLFAVGGAAVMVRVRVQPRHVVVVVVQPVATGPLCPRLVTDVHGALAAGEQRELLDPPPVRTAPPLAC